MNRFTINQKLSTVFLLVLCAGFFQGCIKNEDFQYEKIAVTTWDPDVAVPLIHSDLSIYDIIGRTDSGTISIDDSNKVSLIYKGNIYSVFGYEFLPLINQTYPQTILLTSVDSTQLAQNGTFSKSVTTTFPFSVSNNESLDSVTLRLGTLIVSINSMIPYDGSLNISIPDAVKDGIPFSMDVPFSINSGLPVLAIDSATLEGYHVNLKQGGNANQLKIIYTPTFTFNSSNIQPAVNKQFNIQSIFSDLHVAQAFGNFGQRPLSISVDSSKIRVFNNQISGNVFFDDPKVKFIISNSYGMPIEAHVNSLFAILADGSTPTITGYPDPIPISVPLNIGQTVQTSFELNQSNSNVKTVINQQPRYISYNVNSNTNVPPGSYNFLEDSSRFKVDVEVNLPLKGYTEGFTLRDTTPFTLENIEQVQSAVFRINVINGFPANAKTQVFFTDSAYAIIDSMLTDANELIVESGPLDNNGVVIAPVHKRRDEPFNRTRMENVFKAKYLIIESTVDTKDSPLTHIQIYSTYKIDVRVGVRAQLSFQSN
ncbi:MAG TPA: hypothetical protein PLU53_10185 [Bacteroidia bacterium]|nr:hypothetical protein [Bacteroidia bacterium]